jgi:FixJ family two-component response regulator
MDVSPVVFIVDDDHSVGEAMARLIRLDGYTVGTYTSASEFLIRHEPAIPGCLITDLIMPEMNGLDLQRALLAQGCTRPIVFVTGHGDITTAVVGMRAGALTFLAKPVRRTDLLTTVREAMERDSHARQANHERQRVSHLLATLTPREHQVLRLVVTGMLNKQIAAQLGAAEKTMCTAAVSWTRCGCARPRRWRRCCLPTTWIRTRRRWPAWKRRGITPEPASLRHPVSSLIAGIHPGNRPLGRNARKRPGRHPNVRANPHWSRDMHVRSSRTISLALLILVCASASGQAPPQALGVARMDAGGKLQKPADLETWVFLGTSLGMGYNPGSFNAKRPGQFQVVLMEPNAFRHFKQHGSFAPGSMFLLSFYDPDQRRSINQAGFVQADLTNYEIHLITGSQGDERHVFYMFGAKDSLGTPLPPKNGCVDCHVKHGAFDGTFAQFYPAIRHLIPKDDLERALRNHDIR